MDAELFSFSQTIHSGHPLDVMAIDCSPQQRCQQIGKLALRSLYQELVLYPKPGLVSLRDNGSHHDMNAHTFMQSLFSLRHYFSSIAFAGWRAAPFAELRQLGWQAELRMLQATKGVNTHRGAIFVLGMLCAAAGACGRQQTKINVQNLRANLCEYWGMDLMRHASISTAIVNSTPDSSNDANIDTAASHGQQVAQRYAASGAREEGALAFPSVFDVGVPRWLASFAATGKLHLAQIDCLFALMAHMSDTNLYHRGGAEGAAWVKTQAQAFLMAGGTQAKDWFVQAEQLHHAFVARRLSPGGAADLLAASHFVVSLTQAHTLAKSVSA